MRFSMMTRQSSVKSTLLSFHDKTTVVYSIDLCRGHKVIAHYQVWYLKENRFSAFSDFPLNENKKKNQKPPQTKQIPNKQTKIATKTSKPTQFIQLDFQKCRIYKVTTFLGLIFITCSRFQPFIFLKMIRKYSTIFQQIKFKCFLKCAINFDFNYFKGNAWLQ